VRKTHLVIAALVAAAGSARSSSARTDGSTAVTLAVYGDAPYGSVNHDITELVQTPAFIDAVNADPDVSRVLHVGDIHSGSDHCYSWYDQDVFDLWQGVPFTISGNITNPDSSITAVTDQPENSAGFQDPLVYTPAGRPRPAVAAQPCSSSVTCFWAVSRRPRARATRVSACCISRVADARSRLASASSRLASFRSS